METPDERGTPAQGNTQSGESVINKPECFKERIAICKGCKWHRIAGRIHGCVKPGAYDEWIAENGVILHFSPIEFKEGIPAPCHPEGCGINEPVEHREVLVWKWDFLKHLIEAREVMK